MELDVQRDPLTILGLAAASIVILKALASLTSIPSHNPTAMIIQIAGVLASISIAIGLMVLVLHPGSNR